MSIEISQKELSTIREKNKNLNLFLDKKAAQSFNSLDISDLFTAPLNIITVYNRALKVIAASIAPLTYYDENGNEYYEDDPDTADLGPASEIVTAVSANTLTGLQNADERHNAINVMKRLGGISKVPGDSSKRRFVCEEDLTVIYPKRSRPMRYFLFNDVIVFADRGKGGHPKDVIPIEKVTISSFVTPKKVGKPVLPSFQMSSSDSGDVFTLKFAGSPEKDKLWGELAPRVKEVKVVELYDPSDPSSVAYATANGGSGGNASLSSSLDPASGAMSLIFGSTISAVVALEHRESIGVPTLVEKACVHLMRDLDCEGIFRLSGSSSKVASLKKEVSVNRDFAFSNTDDSLTVAALLKMFFRELEEPLLTFELYDEFISVRLSPLEDFINNIAGILNKLPFNNIQTFLYLMDFLVLIAQHKVNNKMDGKYILTCFILYFYIFIIFRKEHFDCVHTEPA